MSSNKISLRRSTKNNDLICSSSFHQKQFHMLKSNSSLTFFLIYNLFITHRINNHQFCKFTFVFIIIIIIINNVMIFELHKIKNNLMNKDSQQKIQTLIIAFIIIIIKFLSNNIKFLMFALFKNFILKTLFLKISSKFSIFMRSIYDIFATY